ncbi:MAG: asparagine--tRNA ligase [Psychroflexus sp.]|nr:asparagine--tRNA ligase [Psychroflexus sp.]
MEKTSIKHILSQGKISEDYEINAWVKSFRNNMFLAMNDGSCLNNLQCVLPTEKYNEEFIKTINIGCALNIQGTLKESQGKGQRVEVDIKTIKILGKADSEEVRKTILSPKKHSLEKLREQAHLRVRTNTFGAVMRLRSKLSFAVHQYFQTESFQYVTTPIITNSDAEGAGETFRVTNFDLKAIPKTDKNEVNFKQDFFGKPANLTVSGQLEAETYALGLGKVYTFGPTFRAENSNTTRHLSEFWMIEPEVAFCNLEGNMDLAEDFIKYVIDYVLEHCKEDLEFLEQRLIKEESTLPKQQRNEMSLIEKLEFVTSNNFKRVSYTEAIEILKRCKPNKKKKFNFIIEEWGADLQSEHERFLVEKHFKCPVILYDYPANIKAFYMRLNEDNKTVRAMDVLFPGIGEIVGGSQREERLEVLVDKMKTLKRDEKELWWYIDTRRFGTCEHSGFGLGFERLVQFVTGMSNIRDVIPYPRTPKNLDF